MIRSYKGITPQFPETSYIDETAQLIGDVVLGDRVRLMSHVVVVGRTTIGDETEVYPFASLGHRPQDLKFHGEPSSLVIGRRNQIRECAMMSPGTEGGGMITTVGDDGLFMAGIIILTGGFDSIAFWVFPALVVLNALSIPLAMPQIVLNLLVSLFYLVSVLVTPSLNPDNPNETVITGTPGHSATGLRSIQTTDYRRRR